MNKHRITLEVDFDRNRNGTRWEADEDVPKHPDDDAEANRYACSLGSDWDHPPFLKLVSVEPVSS